MTTLIQITDRSGRRQRCHAECYNARGNHCTCICGGTNHGVGLQQAIHNTRKFCHNWIAAAEADPTVQQPLTATVPALAPMLIQRQLYDADDMIISPDATELARIAADKDRDDQRQIAETHGLGAYV